MNATELADALDWVCENHLIGIGNADFKATATMLRQQQAKIAEQERTIKGNRIHIRQLELVTYWLVENRPEVWEDIRKWAENERK